jgi:hypothetical protein
VWADGKMDVTKPTGIFRSGRLINGLEHQTQQLHVFTIPDVTMISTHMLIRKYLNLHM